MKKLIYLIIILFSSTTQINAKEKNDCSGIKKLSKAYIACKSGNFKTGVTNIGKGLSATGNKIKKNTIGKVKKKKTITDETNLDENKVTTVSKLSTATKEKSASIKKTFKNMFNLSKQYPKGTK